jgi:hypothetical protein
MNHGTQHLRNRRLGEAIVPNRRGSNLQDILTLGTMKTRNPKRPHLKTGVLATLRKFGPRDFYTREDWLRKGLVQIPASTDEVLIVPSMLDGWGFVVDFYDPAFCGMVSEGMFKAAIRTANTVVQSLHCTNRAKETRSYTPILNVLLLVAIASIVLGFISLQTSFLQGRTYFFSSNHLSLSFRSGGTSLTRTLSRSFLHPRGPPSQRATDHGQAERFAR